MIPGLSKQRIEAGHLAQGVAAVAFSRCQLTVEPIWQLSPEMELDDWLGLMTYLIPLFGWILVLSRLQPATFVAAQTVWPMVGLRWAPAFKNGTDSDFWSDHFICPQSLVVPGAMDYCRRKFRSQTSDNMDRWKAAQGRGREKRKIRRKKSRRERVRRKKMQMREKVGKSRFTVFFQWFVAPEGRKVGSLKRRVRSQLARWEMKNCTPLWREAHFQVKMYKTHHSRTTFGNCDVEKVHAVVARSTFPSQKCTKQTRFGPLLEVEMLKKRTPLWREAHFQVKMYKTHHARTTFGGSDVEKVHAVVARSTFPSQNVQSTTCSCHFWRFGCRFASLHYTTFHYTPLRYTTLHYTTLHWMTLRHR